MKRLLLKIWRILPFWVQRGARAIISPRYQVAVVAAIINDLGQILLCEHTYRRKHSWGLPGGDLKYGEKPMDGIRREIFEETGLKVQDARLLQVENSIHIHQVTLIYLCSGVSGTFIPNEEVSNILFSDVGNIPILFEDQRKMIDKCLAILNSEK